MAGQKQLTRCVIHDSHPRRSVCQDLAVGAGGSSDATIAYWAPLPRVAQETRFAFLANQATLP